MPKYDLGGQHGAEVFRKMHEAADSSRFRGYPDRAARGTVKLLDAFVDASEVTWLTVAELEGDRPWLPRDHPEDSVVRTLHALFGAIDAVAADDRLTARGRALRQELARAKERALISRDLSVTMRGDAVVFASIAAESGDAGAQPEVHRCV